MDKNPAPPDRRVLAFGIYLVVLPLVLIYILVSIWPGQIPVPKEGQHSAELFGGLVPIGPFGAETLYLLIVAVAGALGAYIHLATSFADYVGNRKLVWSWGWWFVLRPFIGMALAVMVYFVIRGGLMGTTEAASGLSLYGVAAMAGLAGMFSKQATDKLQEVFENLFRTADGPWRGDAMKDAKPTASGKKTSK